MSLSLKNKIYIFIFSLIIVGIVVILVFSANMSTKNKTITKYEVSTNSVIFNEDTNLVDTSLGGTIEKKWDGDFYFVSNQDVSSNLGENSVVFEKASEVIKILGNNYRVTDTGNVVIKEDDVTDIANINETSFYKLKDRLYLIVAGEIYTEDKSIYANKYLIVHIDKQGNASLLNDVLNIKTINPMILTFDKYAFDIANEKIVIGNMVIDLKLINGSTNEYDPNKNIKVAEYDDLKKLSSAYNKLVSDFSQYAGNVNLALSSSYEGIVNNNYYIRNATKDSSSSKEPSQNIVKAENKITINKRVSLRGSVASSAYIDVTYIVTDPEDKYQAVYLLVTGYINDELATEKILLNKYETTYRITNLRPKSEYSISLGYIEVVTDTEGEKNLEDNIEDVINVRTTKPNTKLKIDKIAGGRVYFTLKMYNDFAFENGNLVLYENDEKIDSIAVNNVIALSDEGFTGSLKLGESVGTYQIKLENTKYAGKEVESGVYKNFTFELAN